MEKQILVKCIAYWLVTSATLVFFAIGVFLWIDIIYGTGDPQKNVDALVKAGQYMLNNLSIDTHNYQIKLASIEYVLFQIATYLFWIMLWVFALIYLAQTKIEKYLISIAVPLGVAGLLFTPSAIMISFLARLPMQGAGG